MKVTDDRLLEEIIDCKKRGKLSEQLFDFCLQLVLQLMAKFHYDWDPNKTPIYAGYIGEGRDKLVGHATWKLAEGILNFDPKKGDDPIAYAILIIHAALRKA